MNETWPRLEDPLRQWQRGANETGTHLSVPLVMHLRYEDPADFYAKLSPGRGLGCVLNARRFDPFEFKLHGST